MKMLFIVSHDLDECISQIVMFVPDEHDRTRAIVEARKFGLSHPNILTTIDLPEPQALRILDAAEEYGIYAYSR